jgi:hypothetical protein
MGSGSRTPLFFILMLDGSKYSVVFLLPYMKEIRLAVATEQEDGWPPHPIFNFGKTEKSLFTVKVRPRFLCPLFHTVMRRLATGIRSENCVVRRFRHCANVIQCTYTNQDSITYYTPRLYGIAFCS